MQAPSLSWAQGIQTPREMRNNEVSSHQNTSILLKQYLHFYFAPVQQDISMSVECTRLDW